MPGEFFILLFHNAQGTYVRTPAFYARAAVEISHPIWSSKTMPLIPHDAMGGALEMVCCLFTIIAAVVSYLLTMRF